MSAKLNLFNRYSVIKSLQPEIRQIKNLAPVLFFYCARSESEPQRADPEEILRNILQQLYISGSGSITQVIIKAYKEKRDEARKHGSRKLDPLTINECVEIILKLVELDPVTIVVDALDECNHNTRFKLLNALREIIDRSPNLVKVLISSRDDTDIVNCLKDFPNVLINAKDNGADIKRFIEEEIASSISNRRLLYGTVSEDLKNEITMTLQKGAQGM